MSGAHFGSLRTRGGFRMDEVASALQKTVRRGEEQQALFWATELDLSGYGNYAWKRLRIICSEDVGLAWLEGPTVIRALYENWQETRKEEPKGTAPERSAAMLFLVHAVALLVRAGKTRVVDNACVVFYAGDRKSMGLEIPGYALDHHTARGRRLAGPPAECYDESYRVENPASVDDPYVTEARGIDIRA